MTVQRAFLKLPEKDFFVRTGADCRFSLRGTGLEWRFSADADTTEGECREGLSGGLARIALEETAQTPSAVPFQWRIRLRGRSRDFSIRLDQGVADALVRSLRQIVRLELAQSLEEGLLPDEDKPLQAFALEGVDETLREGGEVR